MFFNTLLMGMKIHSSQGNFAIYETMYIIFLGIYFKDTRMCVKSQLLEYSSEYSVRKSKCPQRIDYMHYAVGIPVENNH